MTDRDIKTIELIINNEQAKKRLDELKVKFEDLKVKHSKAFRPCFGLACCEKQKDTHQTLLAIVCIFLILSFKKETSFCRSLSG